MSAIPNTTRKPNMRFATEDGLVWYTPDFVELARDGKSWRVTLLTDGDLVTGFGLGPRPAYRAALRQARLLHRARHDAQAQMYSHSEGVQLGKTLRLIHDSMLMAFGYEWVPTASVARRLSKRLDYFTEGTPSLTPFIPLIRKWYQLPDGEVLVQRVHGNICLEQLWLEEDSWLIGGWEGDIRLPMPERIVPGCSLEDLASLVRSLYWASGGNTAWCTETMRAVTEGYGHPLLSPLLFAYVLDKICEEIYIETHRPDGQPDVPLRFLEYFRASAPEPPLDNPGSEFLRLSP